LRLRQQAIDLSKQCLEQEGLGGRDEIVRVSEWTVAVEESRRGNLPKDSPPLETANIYQERINYDSEGVLNLQLFSLKGAE
jgi:hypothetical protein